MRLYPFLLLVAMALSGCFQASGNPDALSPGIPMPTGVQALPADGVLTVSVYIEGESTPRYVDDDLGLDQEEIALVFDAPVGQHVFIVIFDYIDPEFPRNNGEPWELARWSSDLVTVTEGEGLSLDVEVDDYQYEDFDGDGVTNKDELIARTDPGDSAVFPDFLVSATVGEGGSISPPERMVIFGSTAAFTVTATTGYTLLSVTGCDGALDGDIYTTGAITADCTVSASFSLNSHSVETNAGTGGTISPERQTVDHGASATFRLFLAPGFDFSEVSVSGCNGTLTQDGVDLIYTTGAITAPCTVSATFSLTEYAVSAEVVGGGGVISPASRIVSHGSTTSFTATPAPGFSIASVAGCDGTLDQNIFTTGIVTAACAVSASFSLNNYAVTATAGPNGSISPASLLVDHGSTASFTVTPETGYSAIVDGTCGGALEDNTYTTGAITADCTVSASFSLDSHSVETNAGTGGTISPERQTVDHGASATFRLFLAPGFGISEASVSGCNGTLTLDGDDLIYTTGAITAPCTVSAAFSLTEYAVSAEVVGSGGDISPESRIVTHGSTASFTVVPAPGFSIASVTGCDGTLDQNIFTTGTVTDACVVSASFSLNNYEVTATAGPDGSISPASLLVDHGSTASFTVTPETGYSAIVEGTCGGALEDNTYTTDAVTGGCTVAAAFTQDQYALTYLAGQNGRIEGDSAQTVGHGDSGTAVTAVPDQGYSFVEWSDGSTANPRTDNVVTGDLSVTAAFTLNQHEITATAGEGGSIAPLSQVVDHGQTASFTIAPSIFHAISSVTGCDGNLGGLTYTTGAITGACVVDARFTEVVPTGLVALADDGEVSIGWSQVANATGYRVYWGNRAAIHPDILNSYDDSASIGDVTTHTVRGLTNDSLYYFVVTATAAAGESGPSAEVSATPQPTPVATGLLNDTGIDWCADDDDRFLACPQDSHPGQDGDRGRDAEAREGTLQKSGAGMAGFDFTKLDASGNVLAANAGEWSCVRDNHTGLVWEVKVDDRNHLRHKDHTYSWYRPDADDDGGNAGTRDRGSCAGSDCDTHALVLAVNAQRLCGAGGWRLPTRVELMSLVHNGRPGGAQIDLDHFPNTVDSTYWSSSPFSNNANRAWSVDFDDGEVDANNKNSSIRVRLVRAGRSAPVAGVSCTGQNSSITQTTPGTDFTELDGGAVVRHATTTLEWQRCALGQDWDSGQCVGSATRHTWREALATAAETGGGWRLPNRNELASIVEEACRQPAINTQIFPDTPANTFWSSSPDVSDEDDAWLVDFEHGVVEPDDKDDRNRVRLVRPGQ